MVNPDIDAFFPFAFDGNVWVFQFLSNWKQLREVTDSGVSGSVIQPIVEMRDLFVRL